MKILYLAPVPYNGIKQRPQYLADGLSREHEVVYMEPTSSGIKSWFRKDLLSDKNVRRESERLSIVRLDGTWTFPRMLSAICQKFSQPEKKKLAQYLFHADLVWVGTCVWYPLIKDYSGKIVYDKMDEEAELAVNPLIRRLIMQSEPLLLVRMSLFFVTARIFFERYSALGLHPILIPNAVDKTQALQVWPVTKRAEQGTRIFGYVGMISHWFDWEAIRTILSASPQNRIVLVGPATVPLLEDPRIEYIGIVNKSEVGKWIEFFDVCLYPFQRSSLIHTINPVKVYEYLAQNKPVLAAKSTEIDVFGKQVKTYTDFIQLHALASTFLPPPFATEIERIQFVIANDWEERSTRVLRYLASLNDDVSRKCRNEV